MAVRAKSRIASYRLLNYEQLPLELYLPFEHGINPQWSRAREHVLWWVTAMNLVAPDRWDAFRGAGFDELAARTYPHVGEDTLCLVSDFITTLFALDDLVDHQASSLGRYRGEMEQLRSYLEDAVRQRANERFQASDVPYSGAIMAIGGALGEITARLRMCLPVEHLEVFISSFSEYLRACVDEALLRHGGRQPISSLSEYAELRIRSAALIPCLEAALISEQVVIPRALREDPLFDVMWQSANLSVSYINDIFSYNKDVTHGHKTNLLIVLQDVVGLSAEDAFMRAKDIHDQIIRDYLMAKSELSPRVDDMKNWEFVTVLLESWMSGSYRWSLPGKNQRYTECTTLASFNPRLT